MANIKLELNSAGVRALLQSGEMMACCESLAKKAASSLGDGYEVSTYTGKTRVNASVSAVSYKARKDNMENNSLLKAIGSV